MLQKVIYQTFPIGSATSRRLVEFNLKVIFILPAHKVQRGLNNSRGEIVSDVRW